MSGEHPEWDYLFVSDLHLSLGYDPQRRAYHPREDFFFDEVFFRWLRWADQSCAGGRRWELVFVGDVLDFFPVDQDMVAQYYRERDRRRRELDLSAPAHVARYWQRQFGAQAPGERAPEWVQRLIFEDDVLAGRIELQPVLPERGDASLPQAAPAPAWALRLYRRYRPGTPGAEGGEGGPLAPRAPAVETADAFRVAGVQDLPPVRADRRRDEDFERRYGFLPTPEKSAAKLDAIYRGHPLFFRALAWFIGRGHRVVFLRGNHDLELCWPQVQERLREWVAREYPAAFGYDEGHPLAADLEERIDFRPGWFYYRPGIFYAEHGCQYDVLNASPNPIHPLMPGNGTFLNPDVGCLGVTCFHNHLEQAHPAWENRPDQGVVLLELVRQDPLKMLGILVRHAPDFLRMARRLWLAGKKTDLEPTQEDFARYGRILGLEPELVRQIYREGDTPLLLRPLLAWLLFSPGGHAVKALALLALSATAVGLGVLWYLVVVPALAGLIPSDFLFATAGQALQLLVRIFLWLAPPVAYALRRRRKQHLHLKPFLPDAARRIHAHLRAEDPDLQYYVAGHDHLPDLQPVERRGDGRHVYYLNTGSWTPYFAEGTRRLCALGQEVQFTFARLVKDGDGYEADLLRWNDEAGRPDPQIVPPAAS